MSWKIEAAQKTNELRTSHSIAGKHYPNFETLDAKIAAGLKNILMNSNFEQKVYLEEQKAQKDNRILRGREIAHTIYEHFRVTGTHESILDFSDLVSATLRGDDV